MKPTIDTQKLLANAPQA